MAVEHMLLSIVRQKGDFERMDASGLVHGEETFARGDDSPPTFPKDATQLAGYYVAHAHWVRSFFSHVLGELGDDDWSVVSNSDLARVTIDVGPHTFVLSRPR